MLRDDTVIWYASDLRVLIPLRRRERKPNGGLNEAAGQMWRVLMGVNHGYVAAN